MIYEGRFTEQWGQNEARTCKLTFIGKNLGPRRVAVGI